MFKFIKLNLLTVVLFLFCYSYAYSSNHKVKNTEVYSCAFETQELFNQFTVIDVNDDGTTWVFNFDDRTQRNCAFYSSMSSNNSGDDWLISPSVNLIGGVEYKLTFEVMAMSGRNPEKMAIYYGQGTTVEAQSVLLGDYTTDGGFPMTETVTFTPPTSGQYNFGFWEHSDMYMVGFRLFNFKIETEQAVVINKDLSAISLTGNLTPQINTENIYEVIVKNVGALIQNNYKVQIIDEGANVLSEVIVNENIESGATKTVQISFTPTILGLMNIKGKVILSGDEDTENDQTSPLNLQVIPKIVPGVVFSCAFESQDMFNQWTIIDANRDDITWSYFSLTGEIPRAMYPTYNANYNANDWLISPSLNLEGGKKYEISFDVKAAIGSIFPEKMAVYYGQGNAVENQETMLGDYILNTSTIQNFNITFTPTTSGQYNFGFQAQSDKNSYEIQLFKVIVKEKAEKDLMAVSISGNKKPIVGVSEEYKISVVNRGSLAQSNFKLQIIDDDDNVLSESIVSQVIDPDQTIEFPINFIPTNSGKMNLRGKIVLEGDSNVDNDITEPFNIDVKSPNANTIVYECPFDDANQFNQWTVINSNQDDITWIFNYDVARYGYSSDYPADDWLISKSISLEGGKTYRLSFDIQGSSSFLEKLKVYYGQGNNVEAQTNLLGEFTTIAWWDTKSVVFTPATSGNYNVGFYACSDKDQLYLFLDNVILEKLIDNDLSATNIAGPLMPLINKVYKYNVTVNNNGALTQNNYKVSLVDENNMILGETVVTEPIAINDSKIISVSFTPSSAGMMKIKGKVSIDGDENPTNNESPLLEIEVQPANDNEWVIIGTGTSEISIQIPFNFHYATSTVQTIYDASEMGITNGIISKINYTYGYDGDAPVNESIKIYLANTSISELSNGWIPDTEFKLVYSGPINLPNNGEYELELELNNPYVYTGDNICVMTTREMGEESIPFVYARVHPVKENKTRQYYSAVMPFDFTQEGSLILYRPHIKFYMNTAPTGSLSGKVTSEGNNVSDVDIQLAPFKLTTKTDAQGKYTFEYVPRGICSLTGSKFGYEEVTINDIIVLEDVDNIKDLEINTLPKFNISGKVINVDGQAVSEASIKVKGYDSYEGMTDANGVFSITGVYKSNDYSIIISKRNLVKYSDTIDVIDANIDLGVILLNDVIIPPLNLVANITEPNVELTWIDPSEGNPITYTLDDGSVETGWRVNANAEGSLGNQFKTTQMGFIESVDIYGLNKGESGNRLVQVDVYNKKRELVTSSERFIIPADDWINVPISYASYNGDFYVMVKFLFESEEAHFIGFDSNGPNAETSTTFYKDENGWMDFTIKTGVFMIRANVIEAGQPSASNYGERGLTKTLATKTNIENVSSAENVSVIVADIHKNRISSSKGVKGYKVWRFAVKDQDNESKWTLLTPSMINNTNFTDQDWTSLMKGTYKYVVRSIYTIGSVSTDAISNMVAKNMEFTVKVNVTSNTPVDEAEGALVTLINKDNDPEHVYTDYISAQGSITFEKVWDGTYNIIISKKKYSTLNIQNIIIEKDMVLDYQIKEIIIKPYNLEANTDESSCTFSWNKTESIFDDFERHEDFTVNSAGEIGWSYIDGDDAQTASLGQQYQYPNANAKMAYIIFNPSQVTPSIAEDEAWMPYNGQKYSVSFCSAVPPNNDWIISPKMSYGEDFIISFWGKSVTDAYGLEHFRVAYSTNGQSMKDFKNFVTPGQYEIAPTEWKYFEYVIPASAQYVAINCISNDAFAFFIDDLFIGLEEEDKALIKYEVYLDNKMVTETVETSFPFMNLKDGKYTAGVKSVYSSGVSDMATIDFKIGLDGVANMNEYKVNIYPNPIGDFINIDGNYTSLEIYNVNGKLLVTANAENNIDVSSLTKGVYFVKIYNNEKFVTIKVTK